MTTQDQQSRLTESQIQEIAGKTLQDHEYEALTTAKYVDGYQVDEMNASAIAFARAIEAAVRAEHKPLRDFVAEIMEVWPDGGIDGDVLQEVAVSHGLLKLKAPNPTEPCGENCGCRDYVTPEEFAQGIECYRRAYKDQQ